MVSFSCDLCQDVCTKAKVDRHFARCRTGSMSCIDCGVEFDRRTIKPHTSCVTEAEKYERRGKNNPTVKNSESYCATCKLDISGAVAAVQHYASKKHRANERRSKQNDNAALAAAIPSTEQATAATKLTAVLATKDKARQATIDERGATDAKQTDESLQTTRRTTRVSRTTSVKRVMKTLLKAAPKKRMRQEKLVKAVTEAMKSEAPSDLATLVTEIAIASRKFSTGKYVQLTK